MASVLIWPCYNRLPSRLVSSSKAISWPLTLLWYKSHVTISFWPPWTDWVQSSGAFCQYLTVHMTCSLSIDLYTPTYSKSYRLHEKVQVIHQTHPVIDLADFMIYGRNCNHKWWCCWQTIAELCDDITQELTAFKWKRKYRNNESWAHEW